MNDNKLQKTLDQFTSEMQKRLEEKEREGFTGWDDPDFTMSLGLMNRLVLKVEKVCYEQEEDPKDLLDIANFAMMLYHRGQPKEE